MFRIDRTLVNLATGRSVQVDGEDEAAGAEGISPNAAASVACMEIEREAIRKAKDKAEAEAEMILENARNEGAAVMLSAREEAEEERRRAWQEGYEEGAKEGKRVCDEKFAEITCEDENMLKRVLGELYTERKRLLDDLEEEVVDLTFDIVRRIISPADEAIGGIFESLIRNALRQIAPEGKVIIRVSPAEYERFFSSGSAVFHLDKGVTVTASVLRDASLGEFDCVIDTEDETVNAGLDTQLKYIKIAFNRAND